MSPRLLTALATAALACVVAAAAGAKEGVRATLESPIPDAVTPGERVTIAWSLADSEGHPFGAGGLFVRLRGPGGETEEASADGAADPDGFYRATVSVPPGGIESVELGLRGIVSGPDGTRRGDMIFPLTNPPRAPIAVAAEEESSDGIAWLGAGAGGALVFVAAVLLRRRRSRATSDRRDTEPPY